MPSKKFWRMSYILVISRTDRDAYRAARAVCLSEVDSTAKMVAIISTTTDQ